MTIASEISRLQDAKANIKTAIEGKGVAVGSDLTLDDYACCIKAIPDTKPGYLKASDLKLLIVGGGGGGGIAWSEIGSGGGGGAICQCTARYMGTSQISVSVGAGGAENTSGGASCVVGSCLSYIANGGSAGPAGSSCHRGGTSGSGCVGGNGSTGGGGGGACGNGNSCHGGLGYNGMGGGGGGGDYSSGGNGCCGGGKGGKSGCDASGCGGGGGGGYCQKGGNRAGTGGGGLVDICYKTTGDYLITCATGGNCCFTCDGYCVHRFTSSGTFCIIC